MTIKDVAKQLTVDAKTVQRYAKKYFPEKIQKGKTTLLSKEEVTFLLERMKENNSRSDLTSTKVVEVMQTSLTPSLRMIEAMKLFEAAANDEIERLKAEKEILAQQKETLQVELDKSKQWYSIKRMQKLNPLQYFDWRELKAESLKQGLEIKKVFDVNYGYVNAYNIAVYQSLFNYLNYGVE